MARASHWKNRHKKYQVLTEKDDTISLELAL